MIVLKIYLLLVILLIVIGSLFVKDAENSGRIVIGLTFIPMLVYLIMTW